MPRKEHIEPATTARDDEHHDGSGIVTRAQAAAAASSDRLVGGTTVPVSDLRDGADPSPWTQEESESEASTSSGVGAPRKSRPGYESMQQQKLNFKTPPIQSLDEILARLVAKDGFTINEITKSEFIRDSLFAKGYKLPITLTENESGVVEKVSPSEPGPKSFEIQLERAIKGISTNEEANSVALSKSVLKKEFLLLNRLARGHQI
ncbi:hypothetical protein EVAR_71025_1 [Eumeta japonica]|uniref:Uncharacterized protein n=1 Tax=Eumeta variegata TaxID=151549 RepID=A0A4C1SGP2_EUMVA|nr:hypothetical protein EVAR_71025_1 [Eumeta japonica]